MQKRVACFVLFFCLKRLAQIFTQLWLRLPTLPLGNECKWQVFLDSLLKYFASPAIFARADMFVDMAAAIVIVPLGWNVFLSKFWPGDFFLPSSLQVFLPFFSLGFEQMRQLSRKNKDAIKVSFLLK